jgi:hypothetical protein
MHILLAIADYRYYTISHWLYATGIHEEICSTVHREVFQRGIGAIRICCLKNTGMSLQDIARFMALAREGDQTLRQRCELLKNHRDNVIARMEEMQRYLEKVTWKVNYFTERLAEYERTKGDGQ